MIDACKLVRDLERATEWCLRVREIATRFADRQMFSICRTAYADVLLWHGDWERADAELTAAVEELGVLRPGRDVDPLARLAELRRRQGRTREAEALLARVEPHRFHALLVGLLALDRGDAATACEAAARFLRRVGEADRFERVAGLDLMVRAAVAAGDEAAARAAAEEIAGIAAACPTAPLRAAALLAEGRVAAAAATPRPPARCWRTPPTSSTTPARATTRRSRGSSSPRCCAPPAGRRGDGRGARGRGARGARRAAAGRARRRALGPRGRGAAAGRARVLERRHRARARAQRAHRRAPRGEPLPQDRRLRAHGAGGRDRLGAHARGYVAGAREIGYRRRCGRAGADLASPFGHHDRRRTMPKVSKDTRVGDDRARRARREARAPRGRLLRLLRVAHRGRRPRGPVPRAARRPLPAPALGLRDRGEGGVPAPGRRGDLRGRRRLLRAAGPHARALRGRGDRRVQPDRRARADDPGRAREPAVRRA